MSRPKQHRYAGPREITIHKIDSFIDEFERWARKYDLPHEQIMRQLGIEFTEDRGLRMRVIRKLKGSANLPAGEKGGTRNHLSSEGAPANVRMREEENPDLGLSKQYSQ